MIFLTNEALSRTYTLNTDRLHRHKCIEYRHSSTRLRIDANNRGMFTFIIYSRTFIIKAKKNM